MTTDPSLLVGVASAIGAVGTLAYVNRRNIHRLMAAVWGEERDETDAGVAGQTTSLGEQLEAISEKIDEDTRQRQADHRQVEREIRRNRRLVFDSMGNLVDALNDEVENASLDADDVEPEWYEFVYEDDETWILDNDDEGSPFQSNN